MANNAVVASKKGKTKVPYKPDEYPDSVKDVVSSAKAICVAHGGTFQNAWMDTTHIQLEYLFDTNHATLNGQMNGHTNGTANGVAKSTKGTQKGKASYIVLNHPADKSHVTRVHPQGAAAKDDPEFDPLKRSLDSLNGTTPIVRSTAAVMQSNYMHRDQVRWLLMGAGATDVGFVNLDHDIAYGVKVVGNYNGVLFRVLVYHQISGALNTNPKKRSAVWEKPGESDPRIEGLRMTLDMGIESNKALQRVTTGRVDLTPEKLTAKIGHISLAA